METEFADLDHSDVRLDKRLRTLMKRFAAIRMACRGWS
ncbi:hypothetical protein JYG32_10665 [Burkholderia pyrrocinia]|nr:hypothetical protein JYG32_10665 [Burkholderia pyrrocinia]